MKTDKKATLHFLCGKMASGKTTLSKQIAVENNSILICEDIWLQRMFPVEITNFNDYLKYSQRLKSIIIPHVKEILSKGISVVLDFPANVPASRQWIKSIYEEMSVEHLLHYIEMSNEKCLEQLKKRNSEKPEGSMEMSVEQFLHITSFFVEPKPEEGFNIKIYNKG